jgi:hypothetical protein
MRVPRNYGTPHWSVEASWFIPPHKGDRVMFRNLLLLVYLLVGLVVASNNGYLANLGDINSIVSAALAVLLWPLVLLGIDLHIGTRAGSRR